MKFKVFIPAAGLGNRLGDLTKYLNKPLISVGTKPALSHIIDKFPLNIEYVIALGYRGDLIKQFISIAYPNLNVQYVDVDKFDGKGSGLGYTLSCCESYLQCPFIFIASDTIVTDDIPEPNFDWMGYAQVDNADAYRTLSLDINQSVLSIKEKLDTYATKLAYIGLSGVKNYKQFWNSFFANENYVSIGEVAGLNGLILDQVKSIQFDWLDTGTIQSLENARQRYKSLDDPIILDKQNEAIWFVNEKVIKYCDDEIFIKNRILRAKQLEGFVPKIISCSRNMYSYLMVEGDVFSRSVSLPLFEDLLNHANTFWSRVEIENQKIENFRDSCHNFYHKKTLNRIVDFYNSQCKEDTVQIINGVTTPKLSDLIDNIDWGWMSNGIPVRFHGDFHFENIIYNPSDNKFTFLDWRQDFNGDLSVGDIYYDLAKLMHGLIVSHDLIEENLFNIDWHDNKIAFNLHRKHSLVQCQSYYEKWLQIHGYDVKKVYILTAIIYLNIAPLHHYPYSLLLYALGKSMLYQYL